MKWNNRRAGRLSTFSRFIIQILSLKFFLFHISRSVLLVGLTRILRTFVSVSVVFVFARMIWRSPILANGPQLCNGSMLGAHSIYTHWHTRLNHTSYLIHYNNKKKLCALHRDEALKRLLKYLQYEAMTRKFMYCRNDKVCHALTHCSTWKVLRAFFFFSLFFLFLYYI